MKHKSLFILLLALLTSTTLHARSETDVEIDGILYDLYNYEATVTGTSIYTGAISIPQSVTFNGRTYSVTRIGSAFDGCKDITSVTIPNSVKSIGQNAFMACSGLTSIIIPNSVTSIGDGAFFGCFNLASISFPESLTRIGARAFGNTAWYDNQPRGMLYAGSVLYQYKEPPRGDIIHVVIKEGTLGIADLAFNYNYGGAHFYTEIGSITIPESVTSIGYGNFEDTPWFNSQPDGIVYAGKVAYTYKGTKPAGDLVIKEGTLGIARNAFMNSGLTSITIPNSIKRIGYCAFYSCSDLTSVTIPSGIIEERAFAGCGLTSLTLGDGVTRIGDGAFSACNSLASITIPKNVTSIGRHAFDHDSTISFKVEEGNAYYDSRNDCNALIETATNTLLSGCPNTIIPNDVTDIGVEAFYGCNGLTSIDIPNSVTSIGSYAFGECYNLASINLGNGVRSIGNRAFWYCQALTSVHITDLAAWCDITFYDNPLWYAQHLYLNGEEITDLVIPEGVTSISDDAFAACSSITSITIPSSVTSIGKGVFSGCRGITSVTIPSSVTSIGEYAFYECANLTSVTIVNGVMDIGNGAFEACVNLTSVTIPNSVTTIGEYNQEIKGETNVEIIPVIA